MVKVGTSKRGGKQWQNYPLELGQDAAYQSYTSRLTEIWSLPKPAQGMNTYFIIIIRFYRSSEIELKL